MRAGVLALSFVVGCADPQPEAAVTASRETAAAPADATVKEANPFPTSILATHPDAEAAALEAVGAVPAWRAVVDRSAYLERRGHSGVAYGTIADAGAQPGLLLVDDTEGGGSLAIAIEVPGSVELHPGDRVAVWGAWTSVSVDRWVWKAKAVGRLVKGKPIVATGLEPADASKAPAEAVPASQVQEGGIATFVVRERPIKVGDGWGVSDPGTTQLVARVVLPGESGAYGGQDLRASNEHWHLRRGESYFVHVGRVWRPRRGGEPAVIYAPGRPTIMR